MKDGLPKFRDFPAESGGGGPRGAQDEFVLAAIAQNLRRLASLVARPPPDRVLCVA